MLLNSNKVYRAWSNMIRRCTSPAASGWKNYGARGISICDHWMDFANFSAALSGTHQADLTLDRIDANGHYEPANVRWATLSQQARNRRVGEVVSQPQASCVTCELLRTEAVRRHRLGLRVSGQKVAASHSEISRAGHLRREIRNRFSLGQSVYQIARRIKLSSLFVQDVIRSAGARKAA